jgi:hypothetical protein
MGMCLFEHCLLHLFHVSSLLGHTMYLLPTPQRPLFSKRLLILFITFTRLPSLFPPHLQLRLGDLMIPVTDPFLIRYWHLLTALCHVHTLPEPNIFWFCEPL